MSGPMNYNSMRLSEVQTAPSSSMKWFVLLATTAGVCIGVLLSTSGQSVSLWAPTATATSSAVKVAPVQPRTTQTVVSSSSNLRYGASEDYSTVQSESVAHGLNARYNSVGEHVGWYAALLMAFVGTTLLTLRAWRRAEKHQRLAMAAVSGTKYSGPEFVTYRSPVRLQAAAAPNAMTTGTPVPTKTMLVVGATGTLGRQIVRQALDSGYDVRCLVRPRQNPADFLRDWGAKTVSGNLAQPKSLPAALVGVHTVVDVSTARPEESIREVDWEGKKALIQCSKAMGIQRYIFFSIVGCDKSPEVPLMNIKYCTEQYLQQLEMPYTVLRTCGFMQALIQQYAVPMLEGEEVYGTQDNTRIAYLNTEDAARMTLACLSNDNTIGKTLTLAGPKAYTVNEVIKLCETLGGMNAKVNNVPLGLLGGLRRVTALFQWSKEVSDRLAFSELLSNNTEFNAPMEDVYEILGLDASETQTLESYLNEYYKKMLGRLKEVKARSGQRGIYL
eukprot:CAMPEP_0174284920 /NCGR_PEP_ID=MMETSP0809-20121228/7108_1 /TAXON_ID=73025 ORGANISM="Eutreptiella gymnastica-like, Strain CCMP1594" /NCGR_SAMPLE_ID=MMETSP0809 /ASSEMBLY_ACC=CAM_ASM_000658 /LENGTH=500 /DNA_ID=CAMNT_0015380575 /DNA_START=20 /DNA_END=1522 /DNA_ORIENTATION=+